ncbi:sulfotransferase [Pseudaestuariivita rosea]|uniref:sulfotransferase n=1 Tax=Pseudaestuariivita rosea TaxID=2763263 RepID=UPI001ABA2500|nr:sulfotransferase [Pseudaestuariivita rosea]
MTDVTPGALILGASRTGSTMMSQIIRLHPDILSVSELFALQGSQALVPGRISGPAFWQQMARPTPLTRVLARPDVSPNEFLYHTVERRRFDVNNCPPILAVVLPHLFEDPDAVFDRLAKGFSTVPAQTRPDHYRHLFSLLMQETGAKMWVERSGGSLLGTGIAAAAFPEARMALLLRDGRDVVLSMQQHKPLRFMVWVWTMGKRFGVDILNPDRHVGQSRMIAFTEQMLGRLLPVRRIIEREPELKDCAAFWSALTQMGIRAFDALPDSRKHVFHYEDVVADPRAQLVPLAGFLGVAPHEGWLVQAERLPEKRPLRRHQLAKEDQKNLDAWTEETRTMLDRFK